jgi:hypothetical protein
LDICQSLFLILSYDTIVLVKLGKFDILLTWRTKQ